MLRIHFTEADIGRVRVASGPDPLWETVLALHLIADRGRVPAVFAPWHRRARAELTQRHLVGAARLLTALAPVKALYFPDFLTPAAAADGLTAGLDAVRATPATSLLREMSWLWRNSRPTAWMRGLAAAEPQRLEELAGALKTVYEAAVVPERSRAGVAVEDDRAHRTRALRDGGVDGLLASLRPLATWDAPVLTVLYPEDRDLYLSGRGLRLVPSYFCWRMPVALADPELPPVLVHPIDHVSAAVRGGGAGRRDAALTGLLGQTRARVLAACESGTTTGELARRLDMSAASVSEHVKALRESSLATSRRDGSRVVHTLTQLGGALLHGVLPNQRPDG
jgi:DNA-binding transcriptional ArsR family regulator